MTNLVSVIDLQGHSVFINPAAIVCIRMGKDDKAAVVVLTGGESIHVSGEESIRGLLDDLAAVTEGALANRSQQPGIPERTLSP
jgi:hypothetical protein